jgi:hypothetical protein
MNLKEKKLPDQIRKKKVYNCNSLINLTHSLYLFLMFSSEYS